MNVKIWPYTLGDNGILAMPMQKNIPVGRDDWKLVKCPVCGEGCWESDGHRELLMAEPGLKVACTLCALKSGLV